MSSSGTQKQGEHDVQSSSSRSGFDDNDGGTPASSGSSSEAITVPTAAHEATTSSIPPPGTGEVMATTTSASGARTSASAIQEPSIGTTGEGNTSMEGETSTANIQGDTQNIPAAPVASAVASSEVDRPQIPVIAVSASKSPTVFFNLARRFLVSEEYVELSALEGAIVSAVDAAHLLERSRLANIVRVETSYVVVEPKRRKQRPQQGGRYQAAHQSDMMRPLPVAAASMAGGTYGLHAVAPIQQVGATTEPYKSGIGDEKIPGKEKQEQRRARIIITVRRTEEYKQWLIENPHHGDDDEHEQTNS